MSNRIETTPTQQFKQVDVKEGNQDNAKRPVQKGDIRRMQALLDTTNSYKTQIQEETQQTPYTLFSQVQQRLHSEYQPKQIQGTNVAHISAFAEQVAQKIQQHLPQLQGQQEFSFTLPPELLDGSQILMKKDSAGNLAIQFLAGSQAASQQLQAELPGLRQTLEKRLGQKKVNLVVNANSDFKHYKEVLNPLMQSEYREKDA